MSTWCVKVCITPAPLVCTKSACSAGTSAVASASRTQHLKYKWKIYDEVLYLWNDKDGETDTAPTMALLPRTIVMVGYTKYEYFILSNNATSSMTTISGAIVHLIIWTKWTISVWKIHSSYKVHSAIIDKHYKHIIAIMICVYMCVGLQYVIFFLHFVGTIAVRNSRLQPIF